MYLQVNNSKKKNKIKSGFKHQNNSIRLIKNITFKIKVYYSHKNSLNFAKKTKKVYIFCILSKKFKLALIS